MYQVQINVGDPSNFPITLVFLSTAQIAFVEMSGFNCLFDQPSVEGNVAAVFSNDGFTVGGLDLDYRTPLNYKQMPELIQWLKQQNLQPPRFQ